MYHRMAMKRLTTTSCVKNRAWHVGYFSVEYDRSVNPLEHGDLYFSHRRGLWNAVIRFCTH
jgi:hypothetical protein